MAKISIHDKVDYLGKVWEINLLFNRSVNGFAQLFRHDNYGRHEALIPIAAVVVIKE